MRIQPDCIPCILTMTMKAIRNLGIPPETEKNLLSKIMAIPELRGPEWHRTSPEIIETIMKLITVTVHDADPFASEKTLLNQQALNLLPFAEKMVQDAPDPLQTAARIAIMGNSMDVMMPQSFSSPEAFFSNTLQTPLSQDSYNRFESLLSKAKKILYFTDNAGEIVFDRLFVRTLKKKYPGIEVVFVVRSLPTLNDATLKEALEVGLDQVGTLMENGIDGPFPGTCLKRCSKALQTLIDHSDLIIAKGGGNFDSLSEEIQGLKIPVTFMLLSKCRPLNNWFQKNLHEPVMESYFPLGRP